MYVEPSTLPPTWRDFEAYRLVKIERRSTRGAARELHLSQTRVCQLVSRVAEFLIETAPAVDDEVQRKKQLYVAEQVAAERLDHLQKEAMAGFNRSREAVRVIGNSMAPGGDVRFLSLAARLSVMAAKLPAPKLCDVLFAPEFAAEDEAAWAEEEALRGQQDRDDEDDEEDDLDSEFPPEEDCSTLAARVPERASRPAAPQVEKPFPAESSISGVSVGLLGKLSETGTVQRLQARHDQTPKAERRKAFFGGK